MTATRRYSAGPMPRMQFLMLGALEKGASLTEATDLALAWATEHPDVDLFEAKPYGEWASSGSQPAAAAPNGSGAASARTTSARRRRP